MPSGPKAHFLRLTQLNSWLVWLCSEAEKQMRRESVGSRGAWVGYWRWRGRDFFRSEGIFFCWKAWWKILHNLVTFLFFRKRNTAAMEEQRRVREDIWPPLFRNMSANILDLKTSEINWFQMSRAQLVPENYWFRSVIFARKNLISARTNLYQVNIKQSGWFSFYCSSCRTEGNMTIWQRYII